MELEPQVHKEILVAHLEKNVLDPGAAPGSDVCVCVSVCMSVSMCVYICICAFMYVCACVCMQACMCVCWNCHALEAFP